MSERGQHAGKTGTLVLRLSVPSQGTLRSVATEFATRVAAYLGDDGSDGQGAGTTLDSLAERVAPTGVDGEITFEFTRIGGELLIRARCTGRSSEVRYPLPA